MSNDKTLRELAEAATPGPWHAVNNGYFYDIGLEARQHAPSFASVHYSPPEKDGAKNAAYMAAAHPQAILTLIDERDAARDENADLRARVETLEKALDTIATAFHGNNPSLAYADAPREAYLEHVLMEARRFARAALSQEGALMDRSLCGQKIFGGCMGDGCERQCSATIYIPADKTPLGHHILKSRLTLLFAIGVLIPFLAISAIAGAETWPNTRSHERPV